MADKDIDLSPITSNVEEDFRTPSISPTTINTQTVNIYNGVAQPAWPSSPTPQPPKLTYAQATSPTKGRANTTTTAGSPSKPPTKKQKASLLQKNRKTEDISEGGYREHRSDSNTEIHGIERGERPKRAAPTKGPTGHLPEIRPFTLIPATNPQAAGSLQQAGEATPGIVQQSAQQNAPPVKKAETHRPGKITTAIPTFPKSMLKNIEVPVSTEYNPYLNTTKRLTKPEGIQVMIPYTVAEYPRVVLSEERIFQYADEEARQNCLLLQPDIIVPLNGGDGLNRRIKDLGDQYKELLRKALPSLITEDDDFSIHKIAPDYMYQPITNVRTYSYKPPFAYAVYDMPEEARTFLRAVQTFAHEPLKTFHYLAYEDLCPSWVLLNLVGEPVKDFKKHVQNCKLALQEALWKDTEIWRKIDDAYLERNFMVDDTSQQRITYFLSTFDVKFQQGTDKTKQTSNFLVVYAEPISNDAARLKEFIKYIKNKRKFPYWSTYLMTKDWDITCIICKLDDHQSITCPFLNSSNWYGPTSEQIIEPELEKALAEKEEETQKLQKRGGTNDRGAYNKRGKK